MHTRSFKLLLAAALMAVGACAAPRGHYVETGTYSSGWHDPWWDGAYHGSYYGGDIYRDGTWVRGWGSYPVYHQPTIVRERPAVQVREHPRVHTRDATPRGRVIRR